MALPTKGRSSTEEESGVIATRSARGEQAARAVRTRTVKRESMIYRPINKELGFRSMVRASEEIASDAS
jgi:hypothetical protein